MHYDAKCMVTICIWSTQFRGQTAALFSMLYSRCDTESLLKGRWQVVSQDGMPHRQQNVFCWFDNILLSLSITQGATAALLHNTTSLQSNQYNYKHSACKNWDLYILDTYKQELIKTDLWCFSFVKPIMHIFAPCESNEGFGIWETAVARGMIF